MGLLDINMNTPEGEGFNSALMAAAQALLTPRAQGGGMGAAFGAFPKAIEHAQLQSQRARMLGLQEKQMGQQGQRMDFDMAQARAKAEQDAALKANVEQWIMTLPPDQQRAARLIPQEFAKKMLPPEPKLESIFVNGSEQKVWTRGPGVEPQPVGSVKRTPMPWEYEIGPDGQPRMRPGVFEAKQRIASAGAGKGATFVQEREEDKAVGKSFGEQYVKIQNAGFGAQSRLSKVARLEQLLDGLATGKFTPMMTDVKAALESIGIRVDAKLGNAQAAEALSNELALSARNTVDGGGMPGAMSDADREFLLKIVPGLAKTPAGNKQLIETNRRIAKRDSEIAKIAREYRKKNGKLDEGFYDELHRFSEANPLFNDLRPAGSSSGWSATEVK